MEPDTLCRLTKPDGSTIQVRLPQRQVEMMADLNHPYRMMVFEALNVVSMEIDEPAKPPLGRSA